MTKARFAYFNLWKRYAIIARTSEHPQFPAEETQNESKQFFWRSRYGTGSGNGSFVVTAGVNDKVNFDEGGAERTGTLTAGTYNGQTLATAVAAAFNGAPSKTLTYACSYSESTAKFTISAGSNFTIRWNTGTNKTTDISDLCGYLDTSNDSGASSYVADYRRIHSTETIDIDLGVAQDYNFVALQNHNIPSTATEIKVQGADDSAFTTNLVTDSLTWASGNIYAFLGTLRTKRYIRVKITAIDSGTAYIQIGPVFVGKYFEPDRTFTIGYSEGYQDESEVTRSDSMVISATERPPFKVRRVRFQRVSDGTKTSIEGLLQECGVRSPFLFCVDYGSPALNTFYVLNDSIGVPVNSGVGRWDWEAELREAL
jgi:hypothetical protein